MHKSTINLLQGAVSFS